MKSREELLVEMKYLARQIQAEEERKRELANLSIPVDSAAELQSKVALLSAELQALKDENNR